MAPASELTADDLPLPPAPAAPPRRWGDGTLYVLLAALVLGAWAFTRLGLYSTKSDAAYRLGVAGGVAMLLLLAYPLRKHLRFMQRFGAGKRWFAAHMVLGVAGPLLILLHSNFEIGSLNAGVAFYAMVTVAVSGVVGRFLYLRLHRNLSGQQTTLAQLRALLHAEDASAAKLRFAPAVMERCHAFDAWAQAHPSIGGLAVLRNLVLLPWQRWRTEYACRRELRRRLVVVAHAEGWPRSRFERRLKGARRLVHAYLDAAQRVAAFSVWTRLFSWWHVAHVPFVYLLVGSAIAHVVAVHAY